jgi:4,5-DOPA dioxygenase extradiol
VTNPMPVIFVGHGNPMNALTRNAWSDGWAAIGQAVPLPRAVLSISAHWYLGDTRVTAMVRPPTIHDFGGFPAELYEVEYPAPGDPDLGRRVAGLLAPESVILDDSSWGLDHGTWSVLRWMFPGADIPVVQLSIDATRPASFHYHLGEGLSPLRSEEVLIVGSGNVVHNLHAANWGRRAPTGYEWAERFDSKVQALLSTGDHESLVEYPALGRDALLSVPTPDHYLPLLYVAGAGGPTAPVSFPVQGMDMGSISMLAVRLD